jgi:A/G-specific adenine glycosylase
VELTAGTARQRRLRRAVLGVGAHALRPLPWRRTRQPWRILVSEVMLQQTQAPRVAGPYRAFVRRFPTPRSCADAAPGSVVRAWAGLGYNGRAVRLHRAAVALRDTHGSAVPAELDALVALPGVGPYTARAVLAFAFEQDMGVVDTNVHRVLCRAVAGRRLSPAEAQGVADDLVPRGRSWTWNQGLMEVGAVHCTARRPACATCPLAGSCAWRAAGGPDPVVRRSGAAGFEGSDRQGRGRLVAALRAGPVRAGAVATATGWPHDPIRARAVADRLVAEGLARRGPGGVLTLP